MFSGQDSSWEERYGERTLTAADLATFGVHLYGNAVVRVTGEATAGL